MRNNLNWKEKVNDLALKGVISYGAEEELQAFICQEIIEKLIEDCRTMSSEKLKERWL